MRAWSFKQVRLFMEARSKTSVLAIGLGMVAGLWLLEQALQLKVTLLLFYLVPVMVVACFAGMARSLAVAFVAAGSWSLSDWASDPGQAPDKHLLDFAVRLAVFSLLAYLEASRESVLRNEREHSRKDPLTGVENTRGFLEKTEAELLRQSRHRRPLTVAYIDVDDFKGVNDQLGHSVGDGLLCAVAGVLRADVRGTDVVARLGGDEFAVLLPETASDEAERVLDRVRNDLRAISEKGGWGVSFSMGAVTSDSASVSPQLLLKRADEAMYEAKSAGKDRLCTANYTG